MFCSPLFHAVCAWKSEGTSNDCETSLVWKVKVLMQALFRSPGLQTLLFYDFQDADGVNSVAYTRRWPGIIQDGDIACCYPGVLQVHVCLH
jgi:hypothetical protein